MENQHKTIAWAINEIKELEFFVDEELDIGPSFNFNFNVTLNPKPLENKLQFIIHASYIKKETNEVFMKSKVATSYLIKDLHLFSKKTEGGKDAVNLPNPLWIALFSIAFTHTRAILSRSSSGTKYAHMLLPAINPEKEFKKSFGSFIN